MKNKRRLESWLAGIGCAVVWVSCPFISVTLYSLIEFIPQDVKLAITENLKIIPAWVWVVVVLSVIAGFVTGRDINRWLYKE